LALQRRPDDNAAPFAVVAFLFRGLAMHASLQWSMVARLLSAWLLTAWLLTATAVVAQRTVWNIDPIGASGARFPSLQAAADSPLIAPGDILVLLPGNHGPLVTSKPLVLLGDATTFVVHAVISDIPSGSEFVIRGVRFFDPTTSTPVADIEARLCAGRIVVDGAAQYVPGSFPQFELRRLVAAAGCADIEVANVTDPGAGVYFAACSATVRGCQLVPASTNPGIDSFSPLTAHQSTVEIVDTVVIGRPYTSNSPGARLIDGVVRFRGASSVRANSSNPALWVLRTRVEADPQVVFGPVENNGGTLLRPLLPALRLAGFGPAQATLSTQPAAPAVVAFGLARPPVEVGLSAMLRLDLDPGLCSLVAGLTSTTGTLPTTTAIPTGLAFVGVAFAAQGIALVENEVRLSNGAALLIH
jgi:hypothetical protein